MRTLLDTVVKRQKNMDTLSALGILPSDVQDALFDLTFSDYVKGPEVDYDYPFSDRLWIFKRCISGYVIYIKFKVEYKADGEVRVISFHVDDIA